MTPTVRHGAWLACLSTVVLNVGNNHASLCLFGSAWQHCP